MEFQLRLDSENVSQLASSRSICVDPDSSIREVLERMKEARAGAVLVCKSERLVGIFTERDALKLMTSGASLDEPVESVMTPNPETLADCDPVAQAISKMAHGGYRRLPLVDADGRPKGFVTVANILHYLVEHFPSVVYNLPPNPHHSTQTREGA